MRAVIFTPFSEHALPKDELPRRGDLVLCADVAYRTATALGIVPDLILGDFDHGEETAFPPASTVIRVPSEKNDTDTMLCLKEAVARGADEIVILGGIGGRLDHTVANLQTLAYAAERGIAVRLTDGVSEARLLMPGCHSLPKRREKYLSLFAFGGDVKGITLTGVKYPLSDAALSPSFPLGVSNEITGEKATLSFRSGKLLVIFSSDF